MNAEEREARRRQRRFTPIRREVAWVLGPLRVLPDFLIIGVQKAATTTLYHNLIKHPNVFPPRYKEVHYFDRYYRKGPLWYRANFPNVFRKTCVNLLRPPFATGEASPGYIFLPHSPRRIRERLPNGKFIVMLRNPVDRAYSHYQHEVRKKCEALSFEDALEQEDARIAGEYEKMVANERYFSRNYWHHSYKTRGHYADQLENWYKSFPNREQTLVILTEDFGEDAFKVLNEVCDFISIPRFEENTYKRTPSPKYDGMTQATRQMLVDYFKPHNQRLYEMLGRDLGWD